MKSYADYIQVPWTEKFVSLPTGIQMCYCVCGPEDGVPLLLIHGVTDGRISWTQVAPMLAKLGYRVYVPEYRGNGKTDKPDPGPGGYSVETHRDDMFAFMDAVGVEKAHVAGHSLGSLTFRVGDVLFCGDTLFAGSCGRTDFAGGSFGQILQSLKRLVSLEGNLRVCPGHEGTTDLDRERKQNPFVRQALQ